MQDREAVSPRPNEVLHRARLRLRSPSGSERPMSRQELADACNGYLYGHAEGCRHAGTLDAKYIGKLERGIYRWPNRLYREALRHVLQAATDTELGFYITRQPTRVIGFDSEIGDSVDRPPAIGLNAGQQPPWLGQSPTEGSIRCDPEEAPEWSIWFGIRLARVVSMVHSWHGTQYGALQTLLHQEILMLDAITPDQRDSAYTMSRRQALVTLAALPGYARRAGPGILGADAATDAFLSDCAVSLAVCWHLLKGSDLQTVGRILSAYLLELEGIAQRFSKYQPTAALLASQAHRICGIVSLHRNQLRVREHHCKRALHFAAIASDINSRVSALISLASTYFYAAGPAQAATTYEQALAFEATMSPLQRSRIYAELSVVYGQLGREKDTLRSVGLAEQLYPEDPEQDPSFLYAEFTPASLALEQGLSYLALAERYPGRGYQRTAANVFARVERGAPSEVPDRIRFEIINHQATTAVLLNDLDAFETYLSRGVDGVLLLGSKQRQKELGTAWRRAANTWPDSPRVRALGERVLPELNG